MAEEEPRTVTRLLQAYANGDGSVLRDLWDLVQKELRAIARGKRAREGDPGAIEDTVLVHEAFIQLFGKRPIGFENRKHLYRYAAKVAAMNEGRPKKTGSQEPVNDTSINEAAEQFSVSRESVLAPKGYPSLHGQTPLSTAATPPSTRPSCPTATQKLI